MAVQELQREAPPQHKFKVQMYDFSCEGLPQYDKSELFLKINFDHFKIFKTDHETDTTSPEWGFKAGFVYVMTYLEKLKHHCLFIQCFDRRSDSPVGQASIDLQTVACGPTHFKLTLKAAGSGENLGCVKFTCIMKMMSQDLVIVLRDMKLTMMGTPGAARIDVTNTLDENQGITCPHSFDGVYDGPHKLTLDTTLGDLLKAPAYEYIKFLVIDEHGVRQGEAQLTFRNAFNTKPEVASPFSVQVTYSCIVGGGEEGIEDIGRVGDLEGNIFFQNLPVYAQMVGGLCVDGQIEGGWWLVKGLPYPNVMDEPPPEWQDPTERDKLDDLLGHTQPDDDNEANLDDLDDEKFYAALDQVELPPPWEKRRERASDRPGNRMYFVDPRSRRTTYKDPRFVPENWDQRIDANTGKVVFQYHKTKGYTYIDPRGCPKDWEMRLSKDGEIYFAYMPAMRTTWTDPRGLPENIEACLDDSGRMYFKNNLERTTTWEDPRIEQQEVLLTQWRNSQMKCWLREQVFCELENIKQRMDEDEGDDDEN
jgi:hypothetical protein